MSCSRSCHSKVTNNMKKLLFIFIVISFVIYSALCKHKNEKNALLDQKPFLQMNEVEKLEVLNKLITGEVDPYKNEHFIVTLKLSDDIKNPVIWDGEIKNVSYGLIKISTLLKGNSWDKWSSNGNFGLIYSGKGLIEIVSEATFDSLEISLRPEYKPRYTDCLPHDCLSSLAEQLRNGGSIKKAHILDGNRAIIEYCKNYEEYKSLQPQSLVKKEAWEEYFKTNNGLEKTLVDSPVRILKELDFIEEVYLNIPFNGKNYILEVSRSDLESFTKINISTLRKGWEEYFVNKYLYNDVNRKLFIKRFQI